MISEAKQKIISFKTTFIDFVKDGVLDKNEYEELKNLTKKNNLEDPKFARDTLKNFSKFNERIKLSYSLIDYSSNEKIKLEFTFTPTYSENELIKGRNILERISNISQKDTLNETVGDDDRCSIASLLNAYLYMGGDFDSAANKFNINGELTYRNLHLLQDKLYLMSNEDGKGGIYSGYKYVSYYDGTIDKVKPSGELLTASDALGIEIIPILGNNLKTINEKKEAVENFFKFNPYGAIQVGVHLNTNDGTLLKPSESLPQDHFVTVFKVKNNYYISDTSSVNNGDGKNVRLLSSNEVENLVYNTIGIINGLILKN